MFCSNCWYFFGCLIFDGGFQKFETFSLLCAKIYLYMCMCVQPQITGETVGEVKPVADMHQRKAEMARNSDCFIALPGPILAFPV